MPPAAQAPSVADKSPLPALVTVCWLKRVVEAEHLRLSGSILSAGPGTVTPQVNSEGRKPPESPSLRLQHPSS